MKKIPQLKISIRNQSEDEAVIDIDGEIGWVNENGEWNTASRIKNKLKEIDQLEVSKIIVNINSLGGFVDDGLAIHDVLASHSAKIETRVIGMTASAATIIAQAGDRRFMSDNSLYLIHKAWGLAIGNVNDMMAVAEDLEAIDKRILNIYAKRSGKSEDDIQELMNENSGGGKWIDADEALGFGLIDEAFEPMKAAASVTRAMIKDYGLPMPEDKKENTTDVSGETIFKTVTTTNTKDNDSEESDREIPEGIDLTEEQLKLVETYN